MPANRRSGPVAVPSFALALALVVFTLLSPVALGHHRSAPVDTVVTASGAAGVTDAPAPEPDSAPGGMDRSPGVLGLPPTVHLLVNRAAAGTGPSVPVQVVVAPGPADRTDAGIRLATDRAGHVPAGVLPENPWWGRAPPRAHA